MQVDRADATPARGATWIEHLRRLDFAPGAWQWDFGAAGNDPAGVLVVETPRYCECGSLKLTQQLFDAANAGQLEELIAWAVVFVSPGAIAAYNEKAST